MTQEVIGMEQDWKYLAERNQASRRHHMNKRKEAEAEIASLRAENEKLRDAVMELSKGLFANNMADAVRLHSIIKKALK